MATGKTPQEIVLVAFKEAEKRAACGDFLYCLGVCSGIFETIIQVFEGDDLSAAFLEYERLKEPFMESHRG